MIIKDLISLRESFELLYRIHLRSLGFWDYKDNSLLVNTKEEDENVSIIRKIYLRNYGRDSRYLRRNKHVDIIFELINIQL